jgi:myo-inositol-1(or 4)-monophosphatase
MSELLDFTIDITKRAGKILKDGFGTNFKIDNKEGINNLVTEYDKKAEDFIIGEIRSKYPDHAILAEESGASNETHSYRWIIDPLDGTVNFANNLPVFSVSIALEKDGEVILGCVYQPVLDEVFYAEKDKGAFMNEKKINVSTKDDIKSAFLVTGFPYNIIENPRGAIDHFVKIIGAGIPVRRLGSAALDLSYVACGRFDAFWEVFLHPWDVAAGMIILKEAGGKITNYDGSDYTFEGETVIASNGLIHQDIIELLK